MRYTGGMSDSNEQTQKTSPGGISAEVGGDPHVIKDVGDMIAEAQNQQSHASQTLSEEEMTALRSKAKAEIEQIFSTGDSVEMARGIVGNPQSPIAAEIEELIERAKMKYGDVPETQAEADQRKEEAAQEIRDAMIGKPAQLAGGVTALASLKEMLAGFSGGAAVMGLANQQEEVRHAGQGILNGGLQEITDLGKSFSPKDAQVTHGIPGKQRSKEAGITA